MHSISNRQHTILRSLYLGSAGSLLSSLGVEAQLVPPTAVAGVRSYVSILSATGEGIAFSSMLRMDRDLLINVYPLPLSETWMRDLEDWCLELNNQLVGRMKNKLLSYGVAVTVGSPILLTGIDVIAGAAPDALVSEHSFQFKIGQMVLTLSTMVGEGIELTEREPSPECEAAMLEGTVYLF